MSAETPTCRVCGPGEARLATQTVKGGATHVRADCGRCGRFIGYVAQRGLDRLPFGRHRGKLLVEVPASYLAWLVRTPGMRLNVVRAAAAELDRRQAAAEPAKKGG
jgi:hypothetical protein